VIDTVLKKIFLKNSALVLIALIAAISIFGAYNVIGQITQLDLTVPPNLSTITTLFDLTNQRSPYASIFANNSSFTRFVEPSLPEVSVQLIASNFTAPMMLVPAKDDTGRLFVVDQIGLVWILNANGTRVTQPFLDIRNKITPLSPGYDERGLLSMTFHPNFAENGKLYVHYDAPLRLGAPANWSHTIHIAEFTVNNTNPNVVNLNSEKTIMLIDKPQGNHNGGPVLFGADGYLYIVLGDGGGANDVGIGHTPQTGNAQDLTKILGKTLRINVNQLINTTNPVIFSGDNVIGNRPYTIPKDNPFVGFEVLPQNAYGNIPINGTIPTEIYSYGHRNPAFATFYSNTSNALLLAEAGQLLFEEVNLVRKGGNYGWRIFEGTHPFNASNPLSTSVNYTTVGYLGDPLIGPIFEGGRDLGVVVIGGAVYWGNSIPELEGKYVFGYFGNPAAQGNGSILVASPPADWNATTEIPLAKGMTPKDNAMWETQKITISNAQQANATGFIRGVSEDQDGELYIMMSSSLGPNVTAAAGRIYKIVPSQPTFSTFLSGKTWTSRVNSSVSYTIDTEALGVGSFKANKDNTAIEYALAVLNTQNITMAHIHIDTGVAVGPIVVWLFPQNPPARLIPGNFNGVLTQGIFTAADFTGPLAGQSINDLIKLINDGKAYVVVHTSQNPPGEIRGYIE
jgi:glucose/arabinose dehydrogenase